MSNRNPWRGLASYEEPQGTSDDYLFCGRDEETLDVVHLIDNNLFITLYGSSGIGKTSLLKAGVMPILKRRDYHPLYVRLSQEPTEISYAEAIVRKLNSSGLEEERNIDIEHADGNDRLFLWNYFATTLFRNADGREVYPVIILDQFEEVFRDADKRKAELLLQQIYLLLNDELEMPNAEGYNYETNYRFVASIREDFLFVLEDSIDEFSLDLYKNNRYRLRPMKPEKAKEVVLIPGKCCVEESEKGDIVNRVILLAQQNKGNFIDTFLLSLICYITFERKRDTNDKLRLSDFAFWGIKPMSNYYQEAIRSLKTEHVRFLQQNLIERDGSRKRVQQELLITNLGLDIYTQLLKGSYKILTLTIEGQTELLHDQLALALFEDRDAYEGHWRWRLVAEKANELVDKNDAYLAQRLLLEITPTELNQPISEIALRKATRNNSAILKGHSSVVQHASYSPNGKYILSASDDKTIIIWDAQNGMKKRVLIGHTESVSYATFSHDGKRIASASYDKTIRIWDIKTGKEIKKFIGHTDSVNTVNFSPDDGHIVSASLDNTIRIWDVNNGTQIRLIHRHPNSAFFSASYSPTGRMIVSAAFDNTVSTWNPDKGVELNTFKGHSGFVWSAMFSPNENNIVSSSHDNTIRIWDVATGNEKACLLGHTKDVCSVAFNSEGNLIVSTSLDRTIRIWDVVSGKGIDLISTLSKKSIGYKSSYFHPNGKQIVSATWDGLVIIWDIEQNKSKYRISGHPDQVLSLAINPDGTQLASALTDGTIHLWDLKRTKKIKKTLFGHFDWVNSIVFSGDGKLIASASNDKDVRVWDIKTDRSFCLEGHSSPVQSVGFNPYNSRIVSASKDGSIIIWDVTTRKKIISWKGHSSTISSVQYSIDGGYIVSASINGTTRIWDSKTGIIQMELKMPDSILSSFLVSSCFSPNGKHIMSSLGNGTVLIRDSLTGSLEKIINGPRLSACFATYSPDSNRIASAFNDGTIITWNAQTGEMIKSFLGHSSAITSIVFDPNNQRFVSASTDGKIKVWNANSAKLLFEFQETPSIAKSLSFSPNGKRIAAAFTDGSIAVFSDTGKIVRSIVGHKGWCNSVSFSPDNNRVVSSSIDIKVWDATNGTELFCMTQHKDWVTCATYSPDGKYIASSSGDRSIKIWDSRSGKIIRTLTNHTAAVWFVAFSPDGKHIVSSSRDRTIRIWNFLSGLEILTLQGHSNMVTSATFSPDGKRIISTSEDNTIRIWDVKTGKETMIIQDYAFRATFSPDNNYLLSISNNSIKIYDALSGIEITTIEEQSLTVYAAVFSPDGRRIASALSDGSIHIYDFPPLQELIDQTRDRFKDRPLTPEERRMYYLE